MRVKVVCTCTMHKSVASQAIIHDQLGICTVRVKCLGVHRHDTVYLG